MFPSDFDILISTFPSLSSLQSVDIRLKFQETNPERFARLEQMHIPRVREFTIYVETTSEVLLNPLFDALIDSDALIAI